MEVSQVRPVSMSTRVGSCIKPFQVVEIAVFAPAVPAGAFSIEVFPD